MIKSILKKLMRKRNNFSQYMDKTAIDLHKAYENLSYDFFKNGEHKVLQKISEYHNPQIIFDVGANKGEWSLIASKIFPDSTIYAFEIVDQTYQKLAINCSDLSNIETYNLGLSDSEGMVDVFYSEDKNEVATFVPGFSEKFHNYKPDKIKSEVTSCDIFCQNNSLDSIDLLKIDVEGGEDKVLKGSEEMLRNGKIKVIQYEYGYINIDTKFLLKDSYEYLGAFGMKIGKIYPNYVDFREYKHIHEDFYGPNYLAVHSSQEDLIRLLSK